MPCIEFLRCEQVVESTWWAFAVLRSHQILILHSLLLILIYSKRAWEWQCSIIQIQIFKNICLCEFCCFYFESKLGALRKYLRELSWADCQSLKVLWCSRTSYLLGNFPIFHSLYPKLIQNLRKSTKFSSATLYVKDPPGLSSPRRFWKCSNNHTPATAFFSPCAPHRAARLEWKANTAKRLHYK